ncbi:sulfurtransferase [Leptospira yasudae]|uniref:sulfurtransferase n=1 Tax=Leptospira yasudae TaxID=2202201 RepID=UPI00142D5443|nr:rhodanese-like domain-containing protein [Leptospira yasudae]
MKHLKNIYYTFLIITLLWGCGGKNSNYDFIPAAFKLHVPIFLKVNTAEELASPSAEDYNQNDFGLITYSTINRWIQDWPNRKPAGVYGKLHIFQVQTGGTGSGQYIFPKAGSGVNVYLLLDADVSFGQTRNNGVIDTETMVPQGSVIDSFVKKYGIDLQTDLVVFAADTPTVSNLQQALRGWYALRYWGAPAKSLAILNGAVSYHASQGNFFTTLFLSPVAGGGKSVQTLLTDNTILQATIADVLHIVKSGNTTFQKVTPIPSKGVFLLDARSAAEYNGVASSTAGPAGKTCATAPCVTPIEGHIKGAVSIPFANLLVDTAVSVQFRTKAEIRTIFSNAGYQSGQTVITYCRTNVRSTVTGFASISILGVPTRYYDGSWIEWGSLATDSRAISDDQKWSNLAAVSPWRTNTAAVTDSLTANPDANVAKYNFTTAQSFARNANNLIDEDKTYLITVGGGGGGSSGGGSGGGGGGGGGNACGG